MNIAIQTVRPILWLSFGLGWKKMATSDKEPWFNHVFGDKIRRRQHQTNKVLFDDGTDFQTKSDSNNGICSGSSHWPYAVVDLKLL